jgi:hypothetical protein
VPVPAGTGLEPCWIFHRPYARGLWRRPCGSTGFTLPSAIALVLFAYGAGALSGPIGAGLLHGLKLVAVAIVAHAVWAWRAPCVQTGSASRLA